MDFPVLHSRKEKEIFLKEIIKTLHVSETEKEIYTICLEILEEDAFQIFYIKILQQVTLDKNTEKNIQQEPFNLIL